MIKILSYNIYYKGTIIKNNRAEIKACNPVLYKNNIIYTSCSKNIIKFIEKNKPYDFVGLQESVRWKNLVGLTPALNSMNVESYKPVDNEVVIFYDKKYILDKINNKIKGWMENEHRPFIILFFEQKICLINIHAGHHGDIYKFDGHLEYILNLPLYKNDINKYLEKLQTYDIILMGDLNDNLKKSETFNILKKKFYGIDGGRELYGVNKKLTCCDPSMNSSKLTVSFDHILSSWPTIRSQVVRVKKASDHNPIISTITTKKNIGYDFDGVLHVDVSDPDSEGQRHATSEYGPYRPFSEIINKIENDFGEGYNIYIITARENDKNNREAVKTFINSTKLKKIFDHIKIYYTSNNDKTEIIHQLKINTFYDDSCLRIKELYNSMENNKLPDMEELFFVKPETFSWVIINGQTAKILCNIETSLTKKLRSDPSISKINNLVKKMENPNMDEMEPIIKLLNHIIKKYNLHLNDKINSFAKDLDKYLDYLAANKIYSKSSVNFNTKTIRNIIQIAVKEINYLVS
ncbi:MAG: hypothetical protein Satyrvirus21_3 [Satyrvirus sp.]|uniref:Endonuclease/exonuclease/phosphatase family protein n=1 Tax=Satyrvirus sp. TaxID=2487771 RepID=A0A3G5AJA7_9VIRU|nr:MAG: hypothetical protein Satyrvirus21_3 [Satyrvirus sp.]